MNQLWSALWGVALLFSLGCSPEAASPANPDLARLAAEKQKQARQLAEAQTNRVPRDTWALFDAAEAGDWTTASNRFARLRLPDPAETALHPSPDGS